jgi:hypothetical protein
MVRLSAGTESPGNEPYRSSVKVGAILAGTDVNAIRQGVPPYANYLFKHALVQDAAYGTLLREPRRALHARIAEALESQFAEIAENQPELLARHCTEANLIEKAAGFWGKAGQHSLERSSILACHRPQLCSVQDAALREFDDLGRDQARGGVVFVAQTQLCAHALKHDRHDTDRLGFENCPVEKNRHCRPRRNDTRPMGQR